MILVHAALKKQIDDTKACLESIIGTDFSLYPARTKSADQHLRSAEASDREAYAIWNHRTTFGSDSFTRPERIGKLIGSSYSDLTVVGEYKKLVEAFRGWYAAGAAAHCLEEARRDYMIAIAKELEKGQVDKDSMIKASECMKNMNEFLIMEHERREVLLAKHVISKEEPDRVKQYKRCAKEEANRMRQLQNAKNEEEVLKAFNKRFDRRMFSLSVLGQIRRTEEQST